MSVQPEQDAFTQDVSDEANAFARNYPDHGLATIAEALEAQLAYYDRGEDFGRAVAVELRKRHDEGIRILCPEDDADDAAWTSDLGAWSAIADAPKDRRVDLWVDIFELTGELVEDCWWEAAARIPDWYRTGKDGSSELAVPIHGHAAFWKPRGTISGPVEDGGPGLLARTNVADDAAFWPSDMRARYENYRSIKAGRIACFTKDSE